MNQDKAPIPNADREPAKAAGHWLLARVGKKVLRPGGKETTEWLIDHLPVLDHDVVEFAPGLGITAAELLSRKPASYTGVDQDPAAVLNTKAKLPAGDNYRIQEASAANTDLPDESADVVIGEAMLTMQTDKHKLEIMREAFRILRPGGRYAIHELGLEPDDLDPAIKEEIQKALARSIKVNARPLTFAEWAHLFEEAGFVVADRYRADMALLEPRRVIADEGITGFVRIVFNVLRQPDIRRRVLNMKKTFDTNREHLMAVGMILVKPVH